MRALTATAFVLVLLYTSACTDESDRAAPLPPCSTPGQVQQFIQNNGYANVTQIRRVDQEWQAAATLGGAPIRLSVDKGCNRVNIRP
jgi:hypothetical protein